MGLLSISYVCFQKPVLSYTFTFFLICSVFGTISLPLLICHFFFFLFFFFKSLQPRFHKSYRQSKTFLNVQTVSSGAVFCSNVVLITTPSSSMHFFSFFDMLPSTSTTTGMTLMLLMFHILLISVFSSWYLNFCFSFSLTLMSPGIVISIMAQLLSFNYGFLALISLSHWIITSHKIFTSSFSTTPSGACSYHFSLLIRLFFPHNFQ